MLSSRRVDPPDTPDFEVLAERDPNCPTCGKAGEIEDCLYGPGWARVELRCANPLCPGNDPDEGPQTWEVTDGD